MRLGLHVQGAHDAAARYIAAVRPPCVKFLDDAPAHLVDLVHSYGGLTILRVYWQHQGASEYGEYLQTVERAARGSAVKAVEVSFNEAMQAGDELTTKAELDIAGMKMAERLGKVAVIGSFSVGMPDLPEWPRYASALRHAAAHGHLLGLHQYGGGSQGMRFDPPWYALRHRQVVAWAKGAGVAMPRIVITEGGIDFLMQADLHTRGWKTMPAGYDYAADLAWWMGELSKDAAIVGVVDFGFGTQDPQWSGFDLADAPDMLAAVTRAQAAITAAPPPKEPPMADLHQMLAAALGSGYSDLRYSLPVNPHGPNGDFGLRPWKGLEYLAIHHTVGPRDQSWAAIAEFHVGKDWAGIGYHLGLRLGHLSYLGDAGLARACCDAQNHRVLCLAVTGNYEAEALAPADAAMLRRAVGVIQVWAQAQLGRRLKVVGHKEVPGQQTACPGRFLMPLVHELAGAAPGPSLPPVVAKPNLGKIAWFAEDVERRMKAEGLTSEAAYWRKTVTSPAIKARDAR